MPIGQFDGFARDRSHPDFLAHACGIAFRIRVFTAPIGLTAARKDQRRAVRLPGDLADLLPVVGMNFVIGAALQPGARATQTFRTPAAFKTHATASPLGDAVRLSGNGALST